MKDMSAAFVHMRVPVERNQLVARNTYLLRFRAAEMARAIKPGQFFMVRLPQASDPLLGRPFALYDTVLDGTGAPVAIDFVYLVVGKMTGRLSRLRPGDELEVWGPLGNGFPELSDVEHVGLVAGGIGQTPFLAYARYLRGQRGYGDAAPRRQPARVSIFYGVRSADLLAGLDDFRATGAAVHIATEDGSTGFHGRVTGLLAERERPQHLVGCGPEPMLHALAELARAWKVPCHLSLETPMACGVGICFTCVTPVRIADGWDYRRVCIDGPVFDAACLAWTE
jgi:dihydroorotate dehydrogenase electron transfer subunit